MREISLEEKETTENPEYKKTEWQMLCEINPYNQESELIQDSITDKQFDWKTRMSYWSNDDVKLMVNWLDSQKDQLDVILDPCPAVRKEKLNKMQRFAYDIVEDFNENNKQLLMIMIGKRSQRVYY